MNRGEVWWGERPDDKRRPFLILFRAEAVPVAAQVLVAPLTTTMRHLPSEVELGPEDGLDRRCVIALDTIGPIRKAYLVERIAVLSPARMVEACSALVAATGC